MMADSVHMVQVPQQTVTKWSSRLLPYKRYVLLLWRGLSFTSSPLAAVAIWAPVHITVGFLFSANITLLVMVGNVLLMTSFFYTLLHFAVKFSGSSTLWTSDQEEQFQVICCQLAYLELILGYTANQLLQQRKTSPWKFYLGWLGVALVVTEAGRWISTGLAVQLIASLILLIPVALEHGWLGEGGGQRVVVTLQTLKERILFLGAHYWRAVKARVDRYRHTHRRQR